MRLLRWGSFALVEIGICDRIHHREGRFGGGGGGGV
jgi:hypothetical protein